MLLRIVLAAATTVSTVSCLCGGPCPQNEVGPPTGPLPRDAGAGEPCDLCYDLGDGGCSNQCVAGLECLNAEKVHGPAPALYSCSQYCATAACPSGTVCLNAGGWSLDGGALAICLPTCATDADCQTGPRAGRCEAFAGTGPRVCHAIECFAGECPTGFGCIEMRCAFGEGVPATSQPTQPGWCRRL
jgi:hypothetical protein